MADEGFSTDRDRPGCGCLSIGLLIMLVMSAALVWAIRAASPPRDETGSLTETGAMGIDSLRVGDCFNAPPGDSEVSVISAKPCTDPHEAQVYAVGFVAEGQYPGEEVVRDAAQARCGTRFEEVLGGHPEVDELEVSSLVPTLQSWPASRRFTCLVQKADGSAIVGDLTRGIPHGA